jgi:DNA polymerase-3 subunit gamma/tau
MDNFVVSARKYRPATFDTVVGQLSITSTLKNAIKNNHVAQAFLFCGPRGVGKTTCARILAKTLNCFHITENIEACNQCESCKSFDEGHSLNVYELDAASNNSVEDIRNLVDQVRFAPQLGTHKVYIIDEVHMLSQAAFNAFLKTLEEPPKHAIFILATTERHKIIPTILSRCQIFDFNRIQIEDIAKHLAEIAQKENIQAETDALHIIAQKADGALRDALSMFDQIVSFAGNNITYKAVIENLNILDYDYYFKITDAIAEENIPSALLTFNEILANGFDGHNFISGLGEHYRNLLVCKDESTLQLLEVGANIKEKYKEQSKKCNVSTLLKGLGLINKCDIHYKGSKNQRLQVELTLMQLCSINSSNEAEKKNESSIIIKAPSTLTSSTTITTPPSSSSIKTKQEPEIVAPASEIKATVNEPAVVKKTILKTAGVSISNFINTPKETEQTKVAPTENKIPYINTSNSTFTLQQFEQAWNNYAKQMMQIGKASLSATLTNRKPSINENFLIEFTIENKVQEETIEIEKTEILSFLRKTLNNYSISLKTIINKSETEKKPYTANEKFKYLAVKNPNLNKLKQQFDLEVD